MADGKVVYEIRADDSKVNSDIDQAEKTIKKSSEKAFSSVESSSEKATKSVKDGAKDSEESIKGSSEQAKKSTEEVEKSASRIGPAFKTAGKVAASGFAAIGGAAIAAGTQAVTGAVDLDQAVNSFLAESGIAKEATLKLADGTTQLVDRSEHYKDVMKEIYADNYGESFEDIGNAMADVRKQMSYLEGDGLKIITEDALTLRDTFGYDVAESVRAANSLVSQFGVDGEVAMDLIAQGAQNGLDFSGELLDSINEYSPQFQKLGLDAEDMFHIFQTGTENGAFNLDKIGDAVKEFSIRVLDGSDTTVAGFEALGMNADKMAAKFAAGGDSAKEAFNETIDALANMKDPLAQNTAGVNLFGTMWEDLGPTVITSLSDVNDSIDQTKDTMGELQAVKYDDLGSMLEGLGRAVEVMLLPLGESLIPLLQELLESIMPIIEENLPVLTEFISEMVTALAPIIEEFLPQLMDIISTLMPIFMQIIEEVLPPILDLINQLLPPLLDLVSTLLPPLISLFGALIEPLVEILEAILPPLIDIINVLIDPIMDLIDMILPPLTTLIKNLAPLFEALMPIIETLAGIFSDVLGGAIDAVMPIIESIMDILDGVITFITGVFTGNWEQAWDGIVGIFKGIFNLIPSIVEGVINGAIAVINGIISGINNLTGTIGIPSIPLIPDVSLPRFHAGGIVDFEAGEGPALLSDREMVLTPRQQANLFSFINNPIPSMGGLGSSTPIIVQNDTPVYLDGKLISKNSTQHQFTDAMIRRVR